jgi:ABC-type cobalamin/Fe3+-siderophores transport system ATPase subunit
MDLTKINVELKNYRCFQESAPAKIQVGRGFTSFVGTNNSGKSTLLRFFYEFRDLFQRLGPTELANIMQASRLGINLRGTSDPADIYSDTNDRGLSFTISLRATEPSSLPVPSRIEFTLERGSPNVSAQAFIGAEPLRRDLLGFDNESLQAGGVGLVANFAPYFEAFRLLSQAIYIGPFRNAINAGSTESYYDLNVGQAFISAWRQFKTGHSRANRRAAIEVTDVIRRIFDFEGLEINASEGGDTLVINIDDKPYQLQELGAGIAHFIIVLAYVATRKPSLILIDEPESNLHPSLQMDFLTTLGTFGSYGVAFATHSLGLARASSETIYSVRRERQGVSHVQPYEATPNLAEFLGSLSFADYQELGFNRVVLVEGPTDVAAIQRFLRLYGVAHQVVLLPLGGSTTIRAKAASQLEELKRITTNLHVLIDSERESEGAPLARPRRAFVEACQALKIDCHVLERKALENYFPDRAVKEAKGSKYRALLPFENLNVANPAWGKAENWRIANAMTHQEVQAAGDLGTFLARLERLCAKASSH